MGYFLDDGTEIDPSTLSIPDKCIKCKQYISKDPKDLVEFTLEWEENMLCTLTRIDQMDSTTFYCGCYIYNPGWKKKVN